MKSILKTLLAVCLGLGFLALDSHAKPSVAFLGLTPESDPNYSEGITKRIRWELGADTSLFSFSEAAIGELFAKGILAGPVPAADDMPKLAKGLGAQYYAFGALEAVAMESKRGKWKKWSLKVKWSQGMRLRVLDGSNGNLVYDGLVKAEVPEDALFSPPDARFGAMAPLQRDGQLRKMSVLVSLECAKALAKAIKEGPKEKAAGAAVGGEAKPSGG